MGFWWDHSTIQLIGQFYLVILMGPLPWDSVGATLPWNSNGATLTWDLGLLLGTLMNPLYIWDFGDHSTMGLTGPFYHGIDGTIVRWDWWTTLTWDWWDRSTMGLMGPFYHGIDGPFYHGIDGTTLKWDWWDHSTMGLMDHSTMGLMGPF